jgi:hypothetical protein
MHTYKKIQPKAISLLPVPVPMSEKNLAPKSTMGYDPQLRPQGSAPVLQKMERQEKEFLPGGPRPQTMNPFGDNLMSFQFPQSSTSNSGDWYRGNNFAWTYPINKRLEYGVEVPLVQVSQAEMVKESPYYPEPDFEEQQDPAYNTYPHPQEFTEDGMPMMRADVKEFFTSGISFTMIILIALLFLVIWNIIKKN